MRAEYDRFYSTHPIPGEEHEGDSDVEIVDTPVRIFQSLCVEILTWIFLCRRKGASTSLMIYCH